MNYYINKEKLKDLSEKAMIELTDQEYETFISDLNDVISFCDSIREEFVSDEIIMDQNNNVLPDLDNNEGKLNYVYEGDSDSFKGEEALINASDKISGYFRIKGCEKIAEKSWNKEN